MMFSGRVARLPSVATVRTVEVDMVAVDVGDGVLCHRAAVERDDDVFPGPGVQRAGGAVVVPAGLAGRLGIHGEVPVALLVATTNPLFPPESQSLLETNDGSPFQPPVVESVQKLTEKLPVVLGEDRVRPAPMAT